MFLVTFVKGPKTTLQYEGDDDEDAMLFFLEIRNYGQYVFVTGNLRFFLRTATCGVCCERYLAVLILQLLK